MQSSLRENNYCTDIGKFCGAEEAAQKERRNYSAHVDVAFYLTIGPLAFPPSSREDTASRDHQCAAGTLPPGFASELRDYLTTLDDETDEWQAFDTASLLQLVTLPLQATNGRALAPADGCSGCACRGDDCGARKKYKAAITLVRQIARRGGAVVMLPGTCRAARAFGHCFHVWFECSREHRIQRWGEWNQLSLAESEAAITDAARQQEDWLNAAFGPRNEGCGLYCHLTLNLDQLSTGIVIPIVGDTVLEWAAARERSLRRPAPNVRDESQPAPGTAPGNVIPFPTQ